jgi:hypothetical protein
LTKWHSQIILLVVPIENEKRRYIEMDSSKIIPVGNTPIRFSVCGKIVGNKFRKRMPIIVVETVNGETGEFGIANGKLGDFPVGSRVEITLEYNPEVNQYYAGSPLEMIKRI